MVREYFFWSSIINKCLLANFIAAGSGEEVLKVLLQREKPDIATAIRERKALISLLDTVGGINAVEGRKLKSYGVPDWSLRNLYSTLA